MFPPFLRKSENGQMWFTEIDHHLEYFVPDKFVFLTILYTYIIIVYNIVNVYFPRTNKLKIILGS